VRITRRQFLKFLAGTAATLGLTEAQLAQISEVLARPNALNGPNVLWIQGQTCGGCITAFADVYVSPDQDESPLDLDTYGYSDILSAESALETLGGASNSTTVEDVLLDIINLQYMNVVMAPSGEVAASVLDHYQKTYTATSNFSDPVLIVEGSIPYKHGSGAANDDDDDFYCGIGEYSNDSIGMREFLRAMIPKSAVVIAYGNCASFGNVPGANNVKYDSSSDKYESTNAIGVEQFMSNESLSTSTGLSFPINITCCPGHPEALLLLVVDYLVYLATESVPVSTYAANYLDSFHRPKQSVHLGYNLYNTPLHLNCPRNSQYGQNLFARRFGDTRGQVYGKPPCLWKLGCQGQDVRTPCHTLGWSRQHASNPYSTGGTNISCIHAGMPCVGCGERGFPDTLRTEY
jgi:hydrogenase small subunit